ncbi:MAG: hypothetical protein ACLFT9_23255 [Coleofasciculus sp.]
MKKTLLIVTTLMALGLPVQAEQIQVNQADEAEMSQQVEPIQTDTNFMCFRLRWGVYCF